MFNKNARQGYMALLLVTLLLALSLGLVAGQEETEEPGSPTESVATLESTAIPEPTATEVTPTDIPTFTPVPMVTEVTPTDVPTATEVTLTDTPMVTEATPTDTPMATEAIPTEIPVMTATAVVEPALGLLYSADFSGDLSMWQVGPGWWLSGTSARVQGEAQPLLWLTQPLYDLVVEAQITGTEGSATVSLRVNGPLSYSATLVVDGTVTLSRGGQVVATAAATPVQAEIPSSLRLSAFAGVIRVSVDGVTLISWTDNAPLPPGQIAFAGLLPLAESETGMPTWTFSAIHLWLAADDPLLNLMPTVEPTLEPTNEPIIEATEVAHIETSVGATETGTEESVTVQSVLPAPELVSPADGSFSHLVRPRLTWRGALGAQAYRVDLARDAAFTDRLLNGYEVLGAGLTLSSGVLPNELLQGRYWWRVAFQDSNGLWSAPSNAFNFIVSLPQSPISGLATTNTRIALTWARALDAARYRLVVEDNNGNVVREIVTVDNRVVRYTPPASEPWPVDRLTWRVDLEISGVWVESPVWFDLTVTPRLLSAPRLQTPVNRSATNAVSPTLSWLPVVDASGQSVSYRVQVATDSRFLDILEEADTNQTSYMLSLTLGEGRYFWRVATLNYLGAVGRWSSAFTLNVGLPGSPRHATVTTNARIPLTWARQADATAYRLWVRDESGASVLDLTISSSVSRYVPPPSSPWPIGHLTWGVDSGVNGVWTESAVVNQFTVTPSLLAPPRLQSPANRVVTNAVSPVLSWQAVAGANARYRVQVAQQSNFRDLVLEADADVPSYTLPVLSGGVYYWRVATLNELNVPGRWSGAFSFTIGLSRLPRNATSTTNTLIALSWARVAEATSYRLLVADNSTFSDPLVDLAIGNNRIVRYAPPRTNPWPRSLLFWRVDTEVDGVWIEAAVVNQFTVTAPLLSAPRLQTPANRSITNVTNPTLGWTAVADRSGADVRYQVQIAQDQRFHRVLMDVTVASNSYPIPQVLDDGVYYWRVSTVNTLDVPGRWSAVASFTIDTLALPAPVLVAPRNGTTTSSAVTLSWRAVRGAAAYEVRWSTELLLPYVETPTDAWQVSTGRRTSWRITQTLLAQTYYWQARAVDVAGNIGEWSEPFTVTVVSAASAAPALNRQTSATPTLTWTAVSWAQGYQVQVATSSNFSSLVYNADSIPAGDLSHTLSQALPQGVYVWRVRARVNGDTWGRWSSMGVFLIALDD